MTALTFGSLFSGIGGMDLGLERAGMVCKWQVEIDDYCTRVLTKHWPDVPKYGDITQLTGDELEAVDVIAGGFPCQDISNAGKRAGIEGERSSLWFDMLRLIRVVRPKYVLVENVAALLVRGMDRVLGDLAESGFDAEWRVLRAGEFGAPHRRARCFILANRLGQGVSGLVADDNPREAGCWGWRGASHLRLIEDRPFSGCDRWPQPLLRRVDDGIPNRMDRLRGLGNAVVPQVAQWVGRRIVEATA